MPASGPAFVLSSYSAPIETDREENDEIVRLWICRAAQLPAFRSYILKTKQYPGKETEHVDAVRAALGLTTAACSVEELQYIRQELEARSDLEKSTLFDNVRMLGRRIGLSMLEQRILAFRVLLRLNAGLWTMMEELMFGWTDISTQQRLAAILGDSMTAVAEALAPTSTLCRARLLDVSEILENNFSEKLTLPCGLINTLITPHRTITSLMSYLIAPATPGTLGIADYPHLTSEIALALAYLKSATGRKRKGVNVLLHGTPGTGKTELAKAICHALGWTLYDIHGKRRADSYYTGPGRLSALLTAQRVLHKTRKAAILFDEIDGIFSQPMSEGRDPVQLKQFFNEFMEEVAVPTIWIANHPKKIDPAFLRRFDIIIAVDEPPRSVKRKILADACTGIAVSENWLDQQAAVERLTPALITRMASVARLASDNEEQGFTASFGLLRNQHFRASGGNNRTETELDLLRYDPTAVNADIDLLALAANVMVVGSARLLFHGAPGTGKSAFAKVLAQEIDRPLQSRHASDLLSPYLGETEHNIRRAFERASADEALLLIDEADSFLQHRERAMRGWEITQVNEFLTQLENYEGVAVCTTNFIDSLDSAAMRRFDAKVEFKPLRQEQRLKLFAQLCQQFDVNAIVDSHEVSARLAHLDTLTPGDFATVARLMRLSAEKSIPGILTALTEEQKHKPKRSGQRIGFVR